MIDDSQIYQMIQAALKMREHSYSPYSHYAVGSALLTKDGQIFGGCNIENIAFGPSNCAERTSFFKAISEGHREFVGIAIAGGPAGKAPLEYCTPCGVCRQVMAEFCKEDFSIIMAKTDSDYKIQTLGELLPESFSPKGQVGAQGQENTEEADGQKS